MRLHLVDHNEPLVREWSKAFRAFPEVTVQQADMLKVAEHCVVSPANGYGFMDGGIDAAYCAFFGDQIERAVQEAVSRRPEGLLPVGASLNAFRKIITHGIKRVGTALGLRLIRYAAAVANR